MSRARRRAMQKRRMLMIGGAAAAALVLIVAIALIVGGHRQDRPTVAMVTIAPTATAQAEDDGASITTQLMIEENTPSPTPSPSPTPEVTPTPEVNTGSERAMSRPTPTAEGFVPVFSKANTEEKIVAITVDDCYQAANLRKIIDLAEQNGGKLTIFPIGENAIREEQSQILKEAWEKGFELENHTYTHNGLYRCTSEELAKEVFSQQMALSSILGVEYHCHFLRPKGGDARNDQRIQQFAKQMGYYGIAHWSCSGASNDETLAKGLKPGAIYLFHTTDKDWAKLERFIPWVAQQGYRMVTLNEMFDYPDNETQTLTMDPKEYPIPTLEPYTVVYTPIKKTTYSWYVYLLQEKLIEQGYLTGEPDGVFGEQGEAAVKAYQRDHGTEQTGVADPDLLRSLIGDNPRL